MALSEANRAIWEAIASHEMPEDGVGLSFREQLARAQGIRTTSADRAIEEYRRFLYLCATTDAPAAPPKAVELVWKLHMQHTRDYNDVLCAAIGTRIDHAPGMDATSDRTGYRALKAAYCATFGDPPAKIWKSGLPMRLMLIIGAVALSAVALLVFPQEAAHWLVLLGLFAATFLVLAGWGRSGSGGFWFEFGGDDPFSDRTENFSRSSDNDGSDDDGGGCGD